MSIAGITRSPLGAFIESPLGVRDDGGIITNVLLAALILAADDEVTYFSAPGPLADETGIGASETLSPVFAHFTDGNLDLDDFTLSSVVAVPFDTDGTYTVAQTAPSSGGSHLLDFGVFDAAGNLLWTEVVNDSTFGFFGPVITNGRVYWLRSELDGLITTGTERLVIYYKDVADGANGGEHELVSRTPASDYNLVGYGIAANVVQADDGAGGTYGLRDGLVVAYLDEENGVQEDHYLRILDADTFAEAAGITRTSGEYTLRGLYVDNQSTVYVVDDFTESAGKTATLDLLAYDQALARDSDRDFIFTAAPAPHTFVGAFAIVNDLVFFTEGAADNVGDVHIADRDGEIVGSLGSADTHVALAWLRKDAPEGNAETGGVAFSTISNDSYDPSGGSYSRSLAGFLTGELGLHADDDFDITQNAGPSADVTLNTGAPGVTWAPTLGPATITAIADQSGSSGTPFAIAATLDDWGIEQSGGLMAWDLDIENVNDIRGGLGGDTATWSTSINLTFTWTLDTAPSGMSIFGLGPSAAISWASPTSGAHNVTVRVSHAGGDDTESFVLNVP